MSFEGKLHDSKSEAIIQWFNILTDGKGVESIADFADGTCFVTLISGLPDANSSISESSFDEETEQSSSELVADVQQKKSSRSKRAAGRNRSAKSVVIQQRYEDIKKYIDAFFNIKSDSIVTYSACASGNEIELSILAVILLSITVQNLLQSNKKKLENATQLETSVQEEIKECLTLVIDRSCNLKKNDLLAILSHTTGKIKGRRTSNRVSEVKVDMKKGEKMYSPIKDFMESPTVYKVAVRKQEVELSKLRKSLHFEESKVDELKAEIKELQEELDQNHRNMESSKERYQKLKQDYDDLENTKESLNQDSENKDEKIKNLRKEHEDIEKENIELKIMVSRIEKELSELQASSSEKDTKIEELNNEILRLNNELRDVRAQIMQDSSHYGDTFVDASGSGTGKNILSEIEQELNDKLDECHTLSSKLLEEKGKNESLKAQLDFVRKEKQGAINEISGLMEQLQNERIVIAELEEKVSEYKQQIEQSAASHSNTKLAIAAQMLSVLKNAKSASAADTPPDGTVPKDRSIGRLWSKESDQMSTRSVSPNQCASVSVANSKLLLSGDKFNKIKNKLYNLACGIKESCVMSDDSVEHLMKMCRKMESAVDIIPILDSIHQLIEKSAVVLSGSKDPSVPQPESSTVSRKRRTSSPISPRRSQDLEAKYRSIVDHCKEEFKTALESKDTEIRECREDIQEKMYEIKKINDKLEQSEKSFREASEKYANAKRYIEKQRAENKKISQMCDAIIQQNKTLNSENKSCNICINLKDELNQEKWQKADFERKNNELKDLVEHFKSKNACVVQEVLELRKQKQKLEFQLKTEAAFLSGTTSDRNAIILQYFQEAKASRQSQELTRVQEQLRKQAPVVNVNTYVYKSGKRCSSETSASNSFASNNLRSGFFQTDDEEDFLNHSSLAQIHAGPSSEKWDRSRRLHEIQRRNTLCPPHLQSSYPLELENTPSETKYYKEEDCYAEEESRSGMPKKRKTMSENYQSPGMKHRSGTSGSRLGFQGKLLTPVRQTGSIMKRTFKTPSSIRRLMRIPRKNKHQ